MGRFFNERLMNRKSFPRGVTRIKDSLDKERKEFSDEQNTNRQTPEPEGAFDTPKREQEDPKPVVPARRGRPRGTGRTYTGHTPKAGSNK